MDEELGTLGKLGSAICLIGAVVIVLHAPPDEDIQTIDQILHYAIQPGTNDDDSPLLLLLSLGHFELPGVVVQKTNGDQASSCTPLPSWLLQSL